MDSPLADESLLLPVHGIQSPSHLLGATGLHLCKDKGFLIAADQIDFPSPRSAEVPAQDFPTQTLQMARSLLLTPVSENKVSLRTRRWAGRPAKNHVDDAGKVHALAM